MLVYIFYKIHVSVTFQSSRTETIERNFSRTDTQFPSPLACKKMRLKSLLQESRIMFISTKLVSGGQ